MEDTDGTTPTGTSVRFAVHIALTCYAMQTANGAWLLRHSKLAWGCWPWSRGVVAVRANGRGADGGGGGDGGEGGGGYGGGGSGAT